MCLGTTEWWPESLPVWKPKCQWSPCYQAPASKLQATVWRPFENQYGKSYRALSQLYHDLLWFPNPCYEGMDGRSLGTFTHLHLEDSFQESVLPFCHVGPDDWTQSVRLGSKCLTLQSHLPSLLSHKIHYEILSVIQPAMFQTHLLFLNLI